MVTLANKQKSPKAILLLWGILFFNAYGVFCQTLEDQAVKAFRANKTKNIDYYVEVLNEADSVIYPKARNYRMKLEQKKKIITVEKQTFRLGSMDVIHRDFYRYNKDFLITSAEEGDISGSSSFAYTYNEKKQLKSIRNKECNAMLFCNTENTFYYYDAYGRTLKEITIADKNDTTEIETSFYENGGNSPAAVNYVYPVAKEEKGDSDSAGITFFEVRTDSIRTTFNASGMPAVCKTYYSDNSKSVETFYYDGQHCLRSEEDVFKKDTLHVKHIERTFNSNQQMLKETTYFAQYKLVTAELTNFYDAKGLLIKTVQYNPDMKRKTVFHYQYY